VTEGPQCRQSIQGRSQEVIEAKSVEKEKLLVIRIAKEKLGGPSN